MHETNEETESDACEKPSIKVQDRNKGLLAIAEKRALVFTGECRSAHSHYRRSVWPFPWSIDMYAPVIHV